MSLTPDFVIQLKGLISLKSEKMPDLGEMVDGKLVGPQKVATLLSGYGDKTPIRTQAVEALMGLIDTARDSASHTRPFGETAEMNWRKLGRHSQVVDSEATRVAFDSLDQMNDEVMVVGYPMGGTRIFIPE